LLEHNEPIIPSKETYAIMHHLESDLIPFIEKIKRHKRKAEEQKEKNEEDDSELNLMNGCPEELIQLLRLACARNLSRAMIIENTFLQ
jgi:nuclear pore complex protein Nup85